MKPNAMSTVAVPPLEIAAPRALKQMWETLNEMMLIALGSLIFVFGMNAVMSPAKLFSGGIGGLALLMSYKFPWLDVGATYLILNIPLVIVGWFRVGKKFTAYSLFGIGIFSIMASLFKPAPLNISDPCWPPFWEALSAESVVASFFVRKDLPVDWISWPFI